MPLRRDASLDAARVGGREDRLTEIFATVVGVCDELATELFERAGLPHDEAFEVQTQVHVPAVGRPDMVIRSLGRTGAPVSVLWSEHKIEAGFGDMQRERYAAEVASFPVPSRLQLIVAGHTEVSDHVDWIGLTWQHVGEFADLVARRQAGPDWRRTAVEPDAPARLRLLFELVTYLEKERLAVVDALDMDDINAFARMAKTAFALDALLERAAQHARPLNPEGTGGTDLRAPYFAAWQSFEIPQDSWLLRFVDHDAGVDLVVADGDYWAPEARGEPAFAAGYAMKDTMLIVLSGQQEWIAELDAAGFSFRAWDGHLCIYRTLPMRDVASFGETLDEQAHSLGRWARDAIDQLAGLDPGDVEVPAVKPRVSRRRSKL